MAERSNEELEKDNDGSILREQQSGEEADDGLTLSRNETISENDSDFDNIDLSFSLFPAADANFDVIKLLNTNARSLSPKIHSLLDRFSEFELDVAVVTESWFCLLYTSDAADE